MNDLTLTSQQLATRPFASIRLALSHRFFALKAMKSSLRNVGLLSSLNLTLVTQFWYREPRNGLVPIFERIICQMFISRKKVQHFSSTVRGHLVRISIECKSVGFFCLIKPGDG